MRILVDLDDVLANWGAGYDAWLDHFSGYARDHGDRFVAASIPRFRELKD